MVLPVLLEIILMESDLTNNSIAPPVLLEIILMESDLPKNSMALPVLLEIILMESELAKKHGITCPVRGHTYEI
jgi:hypothetical protein